MSSDLPQERARELQETAEVIGKLAEDEAAFSSVVEALSARAAERFQSILDEHGLFERCRPVCRSPCRTH